LEGGFLGKGDRFPACCSSVTDEQFAHRGLSPRLTMSVVYSLYDALVSIKVPDEKAKAVIDAMEREMMDKLATKADLASVRELVSKDMEIFTTKFERSLEQLESRLIIRVGQMMAASVVLTCTILGTIQVLR
jgi:hypothetical protein